MPWHTSKSCHEHCCTAGKISFSGSSVLISTPRNTTIKYEDVYGGMPVNLAINVAIWLVCLVTVVAAMSSCKPKMKTIKYVCIPLNLVINIAVCLVSLV